MFLKIQKNILLLTATIILSAGWVLAQPALTFSPVDGATDVAENVNITISSDIALRRANDDANLTNVNIGALITLRENDAAGPAIPFTATINVADDVITINPSGLLPSNTVIYVAITNVESTGGAAIDPDPTSITFTTGDTQTPTVSFSPSGGTTGVPLNSNITITFNEPVRNIDNSPITDFSGIVELKLTNNAGAPVPFSASINGANTIITIDPDDPFESATVYYVEVSSVEDANDNAIGTLSITFTSQDIQPPTASFNPANAATGVSETGNIVITFNEAVRMPDNTTLTNGNVDGLITLKLTNAGGADIPFDATINAGKDVITIDPDSPLPSNATIYVAISSVEDQSDNAYAGGSITFQTGDSQGPIPTFNPANGQTNVSIASNLTITFNENIFRASGGGPFNNTTIDDVVILKLTNAGGADVPFDATFNGSNMITIDPVSNLNGSQTYYLAVKAASVEDNAGNETPLTSITFTTELHPNITNVGPGSTTCAGQTMTITGTNFNSPTVTINGVTATIVGVPTSTSIQITAPGGAAIGSFPVVVTNGSGLSDNSSAYTIKEAINLGLTVAGSPPAPAVSSNFNIVVGSVAPGNGTQPTVSYRVRRIQPTTGSFTSGQTGNSGQLSFGPFSHANPGTYVYEVEATSTNCGTVTLTQTATITIAELSANAGNPTTICQGATITLGGQPPATGGTGFYQYSWSSIPAGFSSTSPNPQVTPSATTTYFLTVTDNGGASDNASVVVTVNPTPAVAFIPVGDEALVRTNYTIEDNDYEINTTATPPDGTRLITGPGVFLKNDGKYYFNPFLSGTGSHQIQYTHTNANGCSNTTSITFNVSASVVDGLLSVYCWNSPNDTDIRVGVTAIPPGRQLTRLRFYNGCYYDAPNATCAGVNPLTPNSYVNAVDIQTGLPVQIPSTYTLDINAIYNNYGANSFYIDIFVKDMFGFETLQSFQFFRVVPPGPTPEILGITERETICSDASPITLSPSIAGYTVNNFTINPGQGGAINGDDFEPGDVNFGGADILPLTVRLNYSDFNGCSNFVDRNFYAIRRPDAPIAPPVSYCQFSAAPFSVFASGYGENYLWYNTDPSGGGATPIERGPILNPPTIDGQSPTQQTFYVTQLLAGCEGSPASTTVTIKPAPDADFSTPPICKERLFTLNGPLDAGNVPYQDYNWDFGDGIGTGSGESVNYSYSNENNYTITLEITSSEGCTNKSTRNITVGLNPVPSFTFNQVCEGDNTQFSGSADIPVTEYQWDFGDGTFTPRGASGNSVPAPNSGTFQNPVHLFGDGVGDYPVTITSFTATGCFGTLTKNITILDYLPFDANDPYSMRDLDGGRGYWTIEDINGNTTWTFDQPNKIILSAPSLENAWVTNATGTYLPNDRSFVNSPCMDITGFTKPVISLDYIADTQQSYDGAVLEYSTNGGVTWTALGNTSSGVEWFTTQGFITGNVGSSQVGWSGQLYKGEAAPFDWMQGRHKLDDIPNKSKVRFRIAFASNSDGEFEGFAFRNVSIRERNRNILVENFTNSEFGPNNAAYLAISETEAVKMQYHMGYPTDDPEFRINPTDPAARAAFYGVPLASGYIPRGFVDGASEGDLTAPWQTQHRDLRSLASAPFLINIDVQSVDGELVVTASADVLQNFAVTDNIRPVMHIAVVEKTAGTHGNVVRKMLPSATGTLIPLPLVEGTTTDEITARWRVSGSVDRSDLAVVVFVQDELTREVYQAAIEKIIADPGVITDVEETISAGLAFFPNPANDELKIRLKEPAKASLRISMNDAVGKEVHRSVFDRGQVEKTLDTSALASGVYFIQVETSNGLVRKKVMIVH